MNITKTLNKIQDEQASWELYNFGETTKEHALYGMIEELGELAHVILKKEQGIRGSEEEHDEAISDSIGGLGIYFISMLTKNKIDAYLIADSIYDYILFTGSSIPSDISELSLYIYDIYSYGGDVDYFDNFLSTINDLSLRLTKLNVLHHIKNAWENVKLRDWRKFPRNGVTE